MYTALQYREYCSSVTALLLHPAAGIGAVRWQAWGLSLDPRLTSVVVMVVGGQRVVEGGIPILYNHLDAVVALKWLNSPGPMKTGAGCNSQMTVRGMFFLIPLDGIV